MTPAGPNPRHPFAVSRLVTFAHVASVDASVAFYALLGFEVQSMLRDAHGQPFWALLQSGQAEIMFARASGPIIPDQQAVLFYMYSPDVSGLRAHLLASGLHDGQDFRGQPGPGGGRRVAFAITRPDYMPAGEFRVSDPDGYVILIGQLGEP